jgi:hypothetical protein
MAKSSIETEQRWMTHIQLKRIDLGQRCAILREDGDQLPNELLIVVVSFIAIIRRFVHRSAVLGAWLRRGTGYAIGRAID